MSAWRCHQPPVVLLGHPFCPLGSQVSEGRRGYGPASFGTGPSVAAANPAQRIAWFHYSESDELAVVLYVNKTCVCLELGCSVYFDRIENEQTH